jgi:hypothetical protein
LQKNTYSLGYSAFKPEELDLPVEQWKFVVAEGDGVFWWSTLTFWWSCMSLLWQKEDRMWKTVENSPLTKFAGP